MAEHEKKIRFSLRTAQEIFTPWQRVNQSKVAHLFLCMILDVQTAMVQKITL